MKSLVQSLEPDELPTLVIVVTALPSNIFPNSFSSLNSFAKVFGSSMLLDIQECDFLLQTASGFHTWLPRNGCQALQTLTGRS